MTYYAIRTCRIEDGNLVSPSRLANGFIWPREGQVVCPDWDPEPYCSRGLHALRAGDLPEDCDQHPGPWVTDGHAAWLILEYDPADMVQLDGQIKLSKCTVVAVFEGVDAPRDATRWLRQHGVTGPIYRGVDVVRHDRTAIVGRYGTATAGDYGTATAGDGGTAIVGRGYGGTATAGDYGTATAGDGGTATAGYGGTATAGDYGTAAAGNEGTAAAGDYGTATAGNEGTAAAGINGQLQIKYFDNRWRTAIAYVGEHAPGLPPGEVIQPGVAYRVDDRGRWSIADPKK